jgi:hypothetical protein
MALYRTTKDHLFFFGHPKPVKGVASLLSFFFQFFFKVYYFLIFFFIFYHVSTLALGVDTWQSIKYWKEKLTEIPSLSFLKTQISFVIRIGTRIIKNKVFKIQILKMYLTQLIKVLR